MKRFFIIASMAILAIGCQKTEIQNEVQNQIGFSTETGKQTRAIVDGTTYDVNQPFGVYAYGYQLETVNDPTTGEPVTQRIENTTSTPMENIEFAYDNSWKATNNVKYYWPNDPRSRLDFYAYSPAHVSDGTAANAHQKLTGDITHSEKENENDTDYGLILSDYEHTNMYVDFMVATPVIGATYLDQNGAVSGTPTSVPLDFKHEMTQINFVVKLNATETIVNGEVTSVEDKYPNIDFTINSIVLNNVVSGATYAYNKADYATTGLKWTPTEDAIASYKIYPATKRTDPEQGDFVNSIGAPALINVDAEDVDEVTEQTVVLRTDPTGTRDEQQLTVNAANPGYKFSTTPVTMIPQAWNNENPQSFTITYTISGEGVATEQIIKTFNFNAASTVAPNWIANNRITYTLIIGLNEITFTPTVSPWSDASGVYYNPDNIAPEE